MKKILFIGFFFSFFTPFTFAQCGANEVEVEVNILTDNYGEETYWTLTDISGTIIMQGGQGGAYGASTLYTNSICVPTTSCLFFDIYDGYGDGIFIPGGYSIYVNNSLAITGVSAFGYQAFQLVNCANPCSTTPDALNDLQAHINGTTILSANDLTLIKNTFYRFPECLAQSEAIILLAKSIVQNFDTQIGALFTTPNTLNGFSKDSAASPGLELERAVLALQQAIFDAVFTPEIYALYPQHINGWKFNSCNSFPGYVDPPTNPLLTKSVDILANFEDPDGMNPFYEINFEQMAHALRPTGLYLAPGSVATVTVPASLVGQDYYIRVGSHDWDLSEKPEYRRFDRISSKFPINSTTIEVFNPFGGAISILVPYGANEGIVEVSLKNGVEAPFFSIKSFYETADFNAELSKPGPWAVFETENVMYTIPKHSIVPGQYDLRQTLLDWETALRGVNSIVARQIIPDKHNMYMIADVDIRTGVYSIGYPMSNSPLNYADVPGAAYFINGPGSDDDVSFHEAGHAWRISSFPGEEEAFVNFPYVMALNYGLNEDLDQAVRYSFDNSNFTVDRTATHRMVSNTFGSARDLSDTESDEVRYQHRGYGHYFEIVNILGWCPLRNFWRQEFIDFQNTGIDYVEQNGIDSRIVRMCIAAQADLRPLFHVFGIIAQDPTAVQNGLNQNGILPSLDVYNRIQEYFNLIPSNNSEFVTYALSVYPNLYSQGPSDNPNFGIGWHYQKSLTYNTTEAQQRIASLQSIVDLYYPNGVPASNANTDVCCLLGTMSIDKINQQILVTGGVEPYNISSSVTGNIQTVTVVDFDGCESTAQFPSTSLNVKLKLFLEGPYNTTTGEMRTALNTNNLIPLAQPYDVAPYNYNGLESVVGLPSADIVDWVLVQARDASNFETVLESRACFVLKNGTLMDIDGSVGVYFSTLTTGTNYRFAVYHKGHLGVLTASNISAGSTTVYDFSTSAAMAQGTQQTKQTGNIFALHAGDFDNNGVINNLDYNLWTLNPAGVNTYQHYEVDLNGVVNNVDYNLWTANRSKVGQVNIHLP